jgi:ElaB/YqjD/DUF883 family membrane-anchored ribosome-binding protein
MKIGEYKQMMSFLLRPKHIHHGTKIVQGVPYVSKGYATGGIIQSNYLKNFIQENKGVSNLEKAKKLNELGYTNSKGKPITDSYLEKFTKLNPEIKGFGKKVSNFSIDELKQYARPKQIQELESGLIDEDTFRKRVLQTRGDLNRTPEQISERYKKSYQNIINDPERLAKREQSNFEYRQRQYLEKGMYPPAQSPKDDLWKDFLKSADKNDRFSLVDEKPNKISRDIFENLKIKDNKTGDILTYDNVDKINPEQYQETIKPYEAKWQIKQSDLPSDLKNQITYVRGPGGNTRNIVIQHNEGIGKNPWNTSLTFQNENNAEYKIRSNFEKQFNNAETLSDKKEAIKSFAQELKEKAPNTISQPGKKIYGEEKDLNQLLETAFKDNPNALSQIKQIFKKSGIEDAEQAEALFKINNSLSSGLNPEMFKVLYPNTYQVASDAFSKISNVIKQNPSSIITGPLKGSLKLLNEAFPYIATAEAGLKIGFEGENPIRAIAETTIPFSEDILHHRDIINNLTPEGKKVYQKNIEDEARNQYSYIEGVPQQIQQRSPEEIEKTRNELDKYMQEAEQKTQEQKEQKIKDIQEKFQNMPDYMNYNTPIGAADGGLISLYYKLND